MEALSSYDLYREGSVENPVVCNDYIQPFIDAGVEQLWTYYCCAQGDKVSNRFMAIPPERTQILGVQLYLYDLRALQKLEKHTSRTYVVDLIKGDYGKLDGKKEHE